MTTHGDQIFQFGGVPVASNLGLLPANVFMVANEGSTKQAWLWWKNKWKKEKLFTSIETAYAKAVAGRNDVISLVPDYDGDLDEALVWDKNDTHFIGESLNPHQPHTDIWQGAAFTPMLTISARGSVFANMTIRHGTAAEDVIGTLISGRYNHFENMYWYGPLVDAQDVAGYRGVQITGHENYFKKCRFGSAALTRDAKNYNLAVEGQNNVFEDCLFEMAIDGTAPHFVGFAVDSSPEMRMTTFLNCRFVAYAANWAVTLGAALFCPQSAGNFSGGAYFDSRCQFINVTKIVATNTSADIWMASVDAAATNVSQIAVKDLGA